MKLTRPFVLLAMAALLTPLAEASRPRVWESNPPALTSLSEHSETAPARAFDLGDVVLVAGENDDATDFHLSAITLLGADSRPSLSSSYPKTRVWAIDFLGSTLVSRSTELSLESHWACADFSCGIASDEREDPLGLAGEGAAQPYVSMPPTPELDALPKVTPAAPEQQKPSLWARFNDWRNGLVPAAKKAIKDFWHTEASQSELQRQAGDERYKTGAQLGDSYGDVQAAVGGVLLGAGQSVAEIEVGGRLVKAVIGVGGKVVRVLEDLGPATGPGKYVKRSESMSGEAKAYEEAVANGRPGEAYSVPYRNPRPRGRQEVHFDGVSDSGIPIDAKVSIVTRQKTVNQAMRQAEALRQHDTIGVWKVQDFGEAMRARRMIQQAKAEDVLRVVVQME